MKDYKPLDDSSLQAISKMYEVVLQMKLHILGLSVNSNIEVEKLPGSVIETDVLLKILICYEALYAHEVSRLGAKNNKVYGNKTIQ